MANKETAHCKRRGRRESAPRNTHDKVFALLKEQLPSGKVLDLPCGQGAFTQNLVDHGYQAVGGDLGAWPDIPQANFHDANMDERLPFDTDSFDAVVSIEGIEHIRRPFDFIQECGRIIRPGGYLIITTPNISSIRSRWRWFITGFHNKCKYPLDESKPELRHHINMISFPQMRYMLHTNGFRIEAAATNRIKPINWVYMLWLPIQYLAGHVILPGGAKNKKHKEIIRETRKQMMSLPILFGETMIIVAKAEGDRL